MPKMDDVNMEVKESVKDNAYRSIFAQIIASFSATVMMFNLAIMNSIITIVNGALLNQTSDSNAFSIDPLQSSWYSSLIHLTHFGGSLLAGVFQDSFGRKKCMLLCNIPQMLSWIILYNAKSVPELYLSSILMGVGAAFAEVPVATYISEIASAKLRGRLFSFTKIGYGFGSLFVFFFSNYLDWRTLALSCAIVPGISIFYLIMIPETPSWLLSKGRKQEALKSLCWLRGWATIGIVNDEFQILQRYIKESKKLGKKVNDFLPTKVTEVEKVENETWSNIKILTKKEFLKPYKIVVITFLLSYTLSLRPVKPYLINILNQFGLGLNSSKILAISSAAQILGALTMALTVNIIGKRRLIFWTFNTSALCLAVIGAYAMLHRSIAFDHSWIIYVSCISIFYLTGYAIGGMPWFICGEIYPQQIRGIAGGVSATTAYIMIFSMVKSYLFLEANFGTSYVFFMYTLLGMVGTFYLYACLPETENKSLEEIENSFKKNTDNYNTEDVAMLNMDKTNTIRVQDLANDK